MPEVTRVTEEVQLLELHEWHVPVRERPERGHPSCATTLWHRPPLLRQLPAAPRRCDLHGLLVPRVQHGVREHLEQRLVDRLRQLAEHRLEQEKREELQVPREEPVPRKAVRLLRYEKRVDLRREVPERLDQL